MELERMGFDLRLVSYCLMAIVLLIAMEAALVAYIRGAIRRWEQEEGGMDQEDVGFRISQYASMRAAPRKRGSYSFPA